MCTPAAVFPSQRLTLHSLRRAEGAWSDVHVPIIPCSEVVACLSPDLLQPITAICAACSGLVSLSLTYSLRNIKMNYDRALFGMKLGDCKGLARALERSETLVRLQVRQG